MTSVLNICVGVDVTEVITFHSPLFATLMVIFYGYSLHPQNQLSDSPPFCDFQR